MSCYIISASCRKADACKTIELSSTDDYNIKGKYFTKICLKMCQSLVLTVQVSDSPIKRKKKRKEKNKQGVKHDL